MLGRQVVQREDRERRADRDSPATIDAVGEVQTQLLCDGEIGFVLRRMNATDKFQCSARPLCRYQ